MTEQMACTIQMLILRIIYDPIQDQGRWRPRRNFESYNLYKDLNIVVHNKLEDLDERIILQEKKIKRF
jgi:hypothetical protein